MLSLAGPLRSEGAAYDAQQGLLVVPAGMRLYQVYKLSQLLGREWRPKGYCFLADASQSVGGFIANNVHHSFTPTAFDETEALDLAVFVGGRASIVHASRSERHELFSSAFGGVGIPGVIVRAYLRLRPSMLFKHLPMKAVPPPREVGPSGRGGYRHALHALLSGRNSAADGKAHVSTVFTTSDEQVELSSWEQVSPSDLPKNCRPTHYRAFVTVPPATDELYSPSRPNFRRDVNATADRRCGCACDYQFATSEFSFGTGLDSLSSWKYTLDYSLQVQVQHAEALARCLEETILQHDASGRPNTTATPASIAPRYLPPSGGGFLTSNNGTAAIAWDVRVKPGLPQDVTEAVPGKVRAAISCAHARDSSFRVWMHTGKSQLDLLPRNVIGPDIERLNQLLDVWDPKRVFSADIIKQRKLYFSGMLRTADPSGTLTL